MKILFVHEVGYLEKPIFEMSELPELLNLQGHEVYFLDFVESPGFRNPRVQFIAGRRFPSAKVGLIHSNPVGGGTFSRIITSLYAVPFLWLLFWRLRPDVIVSYAVPTLGWQSALVGRIIGIPVIYRAIDVSHMLRKGWFAPLVRFSERLLVLLATAVSTHNAALRTYLREIDPRRQKLISIHLPPQIVDSNPTEDRRTVRHNLGKNESDVLVVFLGTLFDFTGLEELIKRHISATRHSWTLLVIGDGPAGKNLRKMSEKVSDLNLIIHLGFVSYDLIWNYLHAADIAINPFRHSLITNSALPNKTFQYLAAGLPTISMNLSGSRTTIGEDNGVVWVEDGEELFAEINKLSRETERRQLLARQAKKFFREHFDQRQENNLQALQFSEFLKMHSEKGYV